MTPLAVASLKTSVAMRYSYRYDNGARASITVDEASGEVTLQCDWGVFGYRWHRAHTGYASIAEFLATCNPDYILDKFGVLKDEYDPTATRRAYRRTILKRRRRGDINRNCAECAWTYLKHQWGVYETYRDQLYLMPDFVNEALEFTDPTTVTYETRKTAQWLRVYEVIKIFIEDLHTVGERR